MHLATRTVRHPRLLAWTVVLALTAAVVGQTSCGHLDEDPMVDGGGSSGGSGGGTSGSVNNCTGAPPTILTHAGTMFLDGGVPEASVAKMQCTDSTEQLPYTNGIGVDISSAGGTAQGCNAYTPNPAVARTAQQIVAGMTKSQLANQMRGTPYGTATMQQFNDKVYHSPQDELQPDWDFSGFVVLAHFALDVARTVANADGLPTWNAGDEFRPARDRQGIK